MDVSLTLVPEPLARAGYRFTFRGANPGDECDGCPFQKLCFGLQPGHRYQITGLRDVTHPCALHDGDRVRVALVEDVPFESTLETRLLRGTAAAWVPVPCGRPECASYGLCHPVGPQPGARHAIVGQAGPMACPAGYELTRVSLRRMDEPKA